MMSREEAASVYLEVLLGFRCAYRKFQDAAEMLTNKEKDVLQNAVSSLVTTENKKRRRI